MTERFSFFQTLLEDLWIVNRTTISDDRGSFARLFCAEEFLKILDNKPILQINQSVNKKKGTVRGLHYQIQPDSETKIVICIKGEMFDVAVDLRKNSKTYLKWHGEILSEHNRNALIIPEGFAHGFQTLTNDCVLIYLHTGLYMPESDRGFHVLDPFLKITWPLPISCISERDKNHPNIIIEANL
nr:dTDP-4-dehydrorhamnose 3,5-epimerase [uncultured Methanospirillum sp.]